MYNIHALNFRLNKFNMQLVYQTQELKIAKQGRALLISVS